uniref:Uncharacterized protein n=1 Tax=Oryza punctata TaxID=4537 RepID=A0A0E0JY63_ORYPU
MTESFTGKQEQALQLLASLQYLEFYGCSGLKSLPGGLHRFSSLYGLGISRCPQIRLLPKEGFPASLQDLSMEGCSINLMHQVKKLEASNPHLKVHDASVTYIVRKVRARCLRGRGTLTQYGPQGTI